MSPTEIEQALRDIAVLVRALRGAHGCGATSEHSYQQVDNAYQAVIALSERTPGSPACDRTDPHHHHADGVMNVPASDCLGYPQHPVPCPAAWYTPIGQSLEWGNLSDRGVDVRSSKESAIGQRHSLGRPVMRRTITYGPWEQVDDV